MNERELIAVFWGTCAAIPVILGIVWLVNRGLDEQEREHRREILDDLTREANEDLDAYRLDEAIAADIEASEGEPIGVRARRLDLRIAQHFPAAPVDSGFATRATDSTRPTAGKI